MELGAGTGVVGLTLGRLGAAPVVITDNEPELVTLMAKNIEASGIGGIGRNLESLDWKFGHAAMHSSPSRPTNWVIAYTPLCWIGQTRQPLCRSCLRLW